VFGIGAYKPVAGRGIAKGRFPDQSAVSRSIIRAPAPTRWRSAVATPLEQQFAALPGLAEMTSMSGIGATLITLAIRSRAEYRWRGGRTCSRLINAATGPSLPKDLPKPAKPYRKDKPGRSGRFLIYAVHSDAAGRSTASMIMRTRSSPQKNWQP